MAELPTTINFELASPTKLLFSADVEMVVVPGVEGDFGVLPQHAPLISTVRPGVIDVYQEGRISEQIFVAGGFAEVTGAHCTVLAEEAVPVREIDRAAAEQRLQNAQDDLKDAQTDAEREQAESAIETAQVMVDAVSKG